MDDKLRHNDSPIKMLELFGQTVPLQKLSEGGAIFFLNMIIEDKKAPHSKVAPLLFSVMEMYGTF